MGWVSGCEVNNRGYVLNGKGIIFSGLHPLSATVIATWPEPAARLHALLPLSASEGGESAQVAKNLTVCQ
jgi:hypothetical protein